MARADETAMQIAVSFRALASLVATSKTIARMAIRASPLFLVRHVAKHNAARMPRALRDSNILGLPSVSTRRGIQSRRTNEKSVSLTDEMA